jgi:hypothetical protein
MGATMSLIRLDTSSCCDNICPCYPFIVKYEGTIEKIILLNSLIPASNKPAIVISVPITIEEAKRIVQKAQRIESFIGHESTARLLTQLFEREIPVSRGMYVPNDRDLAIVVKLKRRLEKPEDVKSVKPEDLEFLLVRYYVGVEVVEHK